MFPDHVICLISNITSQLSPESYIHFVLQTPSWSNWPAHNHMLPLKKSTFRSDWPNPDIVIYTKKCKSINLNTRVNPIYFSIWWCNCTSAVFWWALTTGTTNSICCGSGCVEQRLCPQPNRSHAFLGVQRRQQVILTQELQREVDQQPSDSLQLLSGLFRVCVTEAFLGCVLLQLSRVVNGVVGQTFEDLVIRYQHESPRLLKLHQPSHVKVKSNTAYLL